jgi:hypothetical protein
LADVRINFNLTTEEARSIENAFNLMQQAPMMSHQNSQQTITQSNQFQVASAPAPTLNFYPVFGDDDEDMDDTKSQIHFEQSTPHDRLATSNYQQEPTLTPTYQQSHDHTNPNYQLNEPPPPSTFESQQNPNPSTYQPSQYLIPTSHQVPRT